MNHAIKLRAWDKKSKKIRIVDSIAFDALNGAVKVVNMWGWSVREDKKCIVHKDAKDVELMQALGVKDKENNEIYAKDIMRGKFATGMGGKSTKYKEFNFLVDFHIHDGLCSHIKMPKGYGNYRFMPKLSQCVRVGNLFEHPHLLNQTV